MPLTTFVIVSPTRSSAPITYFPSPEPSSSSNGAAAILAHLSISPSLRAEALSHAPSLPSMSERPPPGKRNTLSAASSPRRDGMQMGDNRKGSVPRALSTPVDGLGLGLPDRRVHKDDALASPRRISTSRPAPSAYPRTALGLALGQNTVPPSPTATPAATPLPGPSLTIPTNEAYYSQPPSATTPRFRSSSTHYTQQGYGSLGGGLFPTPSHRRQRSVTSLAQAPQSPAGSVLQRLRKTASAVGLSMGGGSYDEDQVDDEEEEADEARKSNGTRVWYSSYVTIDWIHDQASESGRPH